MTADYLLAAALMAVYALAGFGLIAVPTWAYFLWKERHGRARPRIRRAR